MNKTKAQRIEEFRILEAKHIDKLQHIEDNFSAGLFSMEGAVELMNEERISHLKVMMDALQTEKDHEKLEEED